MFLRLDLIAGAVRDSGVCIDIAIDSGEASHRLVTGASTGRHAVVRAAAAPEGAGPGLESRPGLEIPGASCVAGEVIELEVPLAALGLGAGAEIALRVSLRLGSELLGEVATGADAPLRISGPEDEAAQWSA